MFGMGHGHGFDAGNGPLFDPLSLGWSAFWDAENVTIAGGKIEQFEDLSGNALHLTQAAAPNQMTVGVGAGGKPAGITAATPITFYMLPAWTDATTDWTIWAVVHVPTGAADQRLFDIQSGRINLFFSGPGTQMVLYDGTANRTFLTPVQPATAFAMILELNGSAGSATLHLSSGSSAPVTYTPRGMGGSKGFFGRYAATNGLLSAYCQQGGIYKGVMSAANRTNMFGAAAVRYGI